MTRVAIISGAAGGIGSAIVDRLTTDGFLTATCDVVPWEGSTTHAVVDVTDPAAVEGFVVQAEQRLGAVDVVITAAGIQNTGPSECVTDDDWHRVIEVNLTGTWNLVRAALPSLIRQRRGRIVTISSEIGIAGLAHYAAYAASKGGVIALTKSLAREYAPLGIGVNCVAPGPIETGMLIREESYNNEWLRTHVPIGHWGRPEDVAATVALLVTEGGGFFVGQVLSPNGGTVI